MGDTLWDKALTELRASNTDDLTVRKEQLILSLLKNWPWTTHYPAAFLTGVITAFPRISIALQILTLNLNKELLKPILAHGKLALAAVEQAQIHAKDTNLRREVLFEQAERNPEELKPAILLYFENHFRESNWHLGGESLNRIINTKDGDMIVAMIDACTQATFDMDMVARMRAIAKTHKQLKDRLSRLW